MTDKRVDTLPSNCQSRRLSTLLELPQRNLHQGQVDVPRVEVTESVHRQAPRAGGHVHVTGPEVWDKDIGRGAGASYPNEERLPITDNSLTIDNGQAHQQEGE